MQWNMTTVLTAQFIYQVSCLAVSCNRMAHLCKHPDLFWQTAAVCCFTVSVLTIKPCGMKSTNSTLFTSQNIVAINFFNDCWFFLIWGWVGAVVTLDISGHGISHNTFRLSFFWDSQVTGRLLNSFMQNKMLPIDIHWWILNIYRDQTVDVSTVRFHGGGRSVYNTVDFFLMWS